MKSKKLFVSLFLIIATILAISGCKGNVKEPHEVIGYLKNLKSYEAKVDMYIKNDKQEIKYTMKQYCKASIGYRLEVGSDRVQIYKNDKIYVADSKSNSKYQLDRSFDELYKISFIGEYIKLLYANEEITFRNENIDGKEYQLVETILPGKNRNMNKAVMYIDVKAYAPTKVLIYDEKNNERVNILYSDFKANGEISDEMFKVE